MASQIDLGAVVPIGKGDWNSDITYERANIVRHNSTAWICKVATSLGVEPTEDSSDWYLLVKDTNSVTSVNGMKGDVVVDTSTADKLTTARTIQTNLASTASASFNGTANVTPGVTGVLPVANGGTSRTDGKAPSLVTKRTIDGVSFDGSANITHFGTCSTAADTAAKVVSVTGFTLATGAEVTVQFTVTNTAASPTLNVNGTGAKAIVYRNAAISAGYLAANRVYKFVYDGTNYELIGDINTDTKYSAATTSKAGIVQLNDTVTSTSTTQAATAHAVKLAYDKAADALESANSSFASAKPMVLSNSKKITAPAGGTWYCCGIFNANEGSSMQPDYVEYKKSQNYAGGATIYSGSNSIKTTISFSICVRIA